MGQYLIDNNVISNYFSGYFGEKGTAFLADVIDQIPNISVITEIEALSWVSNDKSKEAIVREFVKDSNIISITPGVVENCVSIRRGRKIKVPDAIIAATAIANSLVLITSDSDFNNIPGLKLVDPKVL